jgi:protein TonB
MSRPRSSLILTLSASAALHAAGLALIALALGAGPSSAILLDLVAVEGDLGLAAPARAPGAAASGRAGADVAPRRASPPPAPSGAREGAPASRPDRARRPGIAPPAASAPASPPALDEGALERSPGVESAAAAPPVPADPVDAPAPAVPSPSAAAVPPAGVGSAALGTFGTPGGPKGEDADARSGPAGASPRSGAGSPAVPDGVAGGGAGRSETGGPFLALKGPAEGSGAPPEYTAYLGRFRRRVQAALAYPLAARRQGLSGRVELEVLLDPSGRIASVRVLRSSSHAQLDDAALSTVKSVKPEPFPAELPRRPLRVRFPLAFELR